MIYFAVFLLSLQVALLAYQVSLLKIDTKKLKWKIKKNKGSIITAEDMEQKKQEEVDRLLNVKYERTKN